MLPKFGPTPSALEKPFQEANVPHTGSIVSSLIRLAMRRMPAHGFGATASTRGVGQPKDAMTIGSHGKTV